MADLSRAATPFAVCSILDQDERLSGAQAQPSTAAHQGDGVDTTRSARFCGECGTPHEPEAAFCAGCGSPVGGGSAPAADVAEGTAGSAAGASDAPTQVAPVAYGALPSLDAQGGSIFGLPPTSQTGEGAGGYPAPVYAAAPPSSSNTTVRNAVIAVAAALVLLGGIFAAMQLFGSDRSTPPAAAPSPVASSAPSSTEAGGSASMPPTTAPTTSARTPVDIRASYTVYSTASGFSGPYAKAASVTSLTSAKFVPSVAQAYAASGADGDVVLRDVHSPETGKDYTMTCRAQGDGTVLCSGGNNAQVVLYN